MTIDFLARETELQAALAAAKQAFGAAKPGTRKFLRTLDALAEANAALAKLYDDVLRGRN